VEAAPTLVPAILKSGEGPGDEVRSSAGTREYPIWLPSSCWSSSLASLSGIVFAATFKIIKMAATNRTLLAEVPLPCGTGVIFFLRILGELRRKQGEREARVAR